MTHFADILKNWVSEFSRITHPRPASCVEVDHAASDLTTTASEGVKVGRFGSLKPLGGSFFCSEFHSLANTIAEDRTSSGSGECPSKMNLFLDFHNDHSIQGTNEPVVTPAGGRHLRPHRKS